MKTILIYTLGFAIALYLLTPIFAQEEHEHEHGSSELLIAKDQFKELGIQVAVVEAGTIDTQIELTGELVVNADRLAHIVPQVSGIARHIFANVGSSVKAGELIAWLESAELGQAKIDYLAKFSELSCCTMELTRAKDIHKNTVALLKYLESNPSLATLKSFSTKTMGDNRSKLIAPYAEYTFAKASLDRQQQLLNQNITSQEKFQEAQREMEKARANYVATTDTIAFRVDQNLREETRAEQMRKIELKGAERTLYLLGLTSADIKELELLSQSPILASDPVQQCTDPNCTGCGLDRIPASPEKIAEANRRLAWYPLRSPLDGVVIAKRLTQGEAVKDDTLCFVIADLTRVWADFRIYSKDLSTIRIGQSVLVSGDSISQVWGKIIYVSKIIDPQTRTTLARVVLDNHSGNLRPGAFVTGKVAQQGEAKAIVIAKSAIQYIDDTPHVFVFNDHAFTQQPISLGLNDATRVEVLAGLELGDSIAMTGSFVLKTESEKNKVSSDCGHAH